MFRLNRADARLAFERRCCKHIGTAMKLKALLAFGLTMAAVTATNVSFAQSGDAALLTVSGRIARTNSPDHKVYVFSFADLQKLDNTHITSTTTWEGKAEFDGPRVRDILKAVGAASDATEVAVVAIDGYVKSIPIEDFKKWEVIAAHTQNGKRLTVETKGPLWIMYPNDKYPEDLRNHVTNTKLVWALTGLVVK